MLGVLNGLPYPIGVPPVALEYHLIVVPGVVELADSVTGPEEQRLPFIVIGLAGNGVTTN